MKGYNETEWLSEALEVNEWEYTRSTLSRIASVCVQPILIRRE